MCGWATPQFRNFLDVVNEYYCIIKYFVVNNSVFLYEFSCYKLLKIDDHLWLTHRYNGQFTGYANRGSGRIWLDNVYCNGTETDIALCPHNAWGSHDCGHHEDVSVRCTGPTVTGIIKTGVLRPHGSTVPAAPPIRLPIPNPNPNPNPNTKTHPNHPYF